MNNIAAIEQEDVRHLAAHLLYQTAQTRQSLRLTRHISMTV